MSYASLLFVAFVVVPPSRLSFFLLWLCRISSFFSVSSVCNTFRFVATYGRHEHLQCQPSIST